MRSAYDKACGVEQREWQCEACGVATFVVTGNDPPDNCWASNEGPLRAVADVQAETWRADPEDAAE